MDAQAQQMTFQELASQNPHYNGQLLVLCGAGQCDPNDFNDRNSQLLFRMDTIGFVSDTLLGLGAGTLITFTKGQTQTAFQQNQGQGTVVSPMGTKPQAYVSSANKDGSLTQNCAAFVALGITIRPDVLYVNADSADSHDNQLCAAYLQTTAYYHAQLSMQLASAVAVSLTDEQAGCTKQLSDMGAWGGVEGMVDALHAHSSNSSVPNASQSLRAGYVFTTKSTGDNQYMSFELQKTKQIEVSASALPTTTAAVIMLWKIQLWGSVIAASIACSPFAVRGNRLVSANG